jgi:hypothetical protein
VVSATSLHRYIGLANTPVDLRLWLSRGRVAPEHRKDGKKPYPSPYDAYLLDSSVSALLITQLPRALLNIAVFLYLVGFGLYALFAWLEDVPDVSHNYRNIFIVFIISIGCCVIYICMCGLSKILDDKKLGDNFEIQRLGEDLELQYRKELENLGRKAEIAPMNGAEVQTELVQAIRALTAEVTQLRQVMTLKSPSASSL